jgi:hypothetical protein
VNRKKCVYAMFSIVLYLKSLRDIYQIKAAFAVVIYMQLWLILLQNYTFNTGLDSPQAVILFSQSHNFAPASKQVVD